MAQGVQNDLKEAARARWLASATLLAQIPATSLYSGSVTGGPTPPYASFRCEFLGKEEQMPAIVGSTYLHKERLTVSVWMTDEDTVGDIAGMILGAYADESMTVADSTLLAVYPDAEINVEEDGSYRGNPVWRGDVGFEVWLERTRRGQSVATGQSTWSQFTTRTWANWNTATWGNMA